MPKQIDYRLNDEQLTEIEKTIRYDKRAKLVQRATGIRLLHLGYLPQDVATMLGVGYSRVCRWHQRWREGGLSGLIDQPRSGRPRKADEEYIQVLEDALAHEPSHYGYEFAIWTVDRLAQHVTEQTGTELSVERLRILMKEHDYVYRRPKHDLTAHQDAEARADALTLLEDLKKDHSLPILSSSLWTKQP